MVEQLLNDLFLYIRLGAQNVKIRTLVSPFGEVRAKTWPLLSRADVI